MVTETKEELKTEIATAKKTQESLLRAVENVGGEGRTIVAESRKKEATGGKQATLPKQEPGKRPVVKKEVKEQKKPEDIAALLAATVTMEPEASVEGDMPKEKILELYKNGKSIRDISRELGMGQGEVKLVIDLYGL